MNKQKQLFMIGGPNGAGKTTSAFTLMPELIDCKEYVNADSIATSLSPFNIEAMAIKSGKLMLARIKELIRLNQNFAFETTMASKSFVKLLTACKQNGYQINLLYIWLLSYKLAVERVNHRAATGGHSISSTVIKRRYYRSMNNFKNMYMPIADRWVICDNSSSEPMIFAQKQCAESSIEIADRHLWNNFNEMLTCKKNNSTI